MIATRATEAAKQWWTDNREGVITNVSDTAKDYWDKNKDGLIQKAKDAWGENKGDILNAAKDFAGEAFTSAKDYFAENKGAIVDKAVATAKDFASELSGKTLKEAMAYTDKKLEESRTKVVDKLLASGVTMEELDLDGDGNVSNSEVDAYREKNPIGFFQITGGAGALWYLLWQAKQRMGSGPQVVPDSNPTTSGAVV
jgi:hypothetical protein